MAHEAAQLASLTRRGNGRPRFWRVGNELINPYAVERVRRGPKVRVGLVALSSVTVTFTSGATVTYEGEKADELWWLVDAEG